MDGRVLDPTSPVAARLEMPNLRALAAEGANFLRTYAASPQCVPSRTTMFAGRHTHSIKAWSNSQGIAGIPGKDWSTAAGLEPVCLKSYTREVCEAMARAGNVTATILDALRDKKCDAVVMARDLYDLYKMDTRYCHLSVIETLFPARLGWAVHRLSKSTGS